MDNDNFGFGVILVDDSPVTNSYPVSVFHALELVDVEGVECTGVSVRTSRMLETRYTCLSQGIFVCVGVI